MQLLRKFRPFFFLLYYYFSKNNNCTPVLNLWIFNGGFVAEPCSGLRGTRAQRGCACRALRRWPFGLQLIVFRGEPKGFLFLTKFEESNCARFGKVLKVRGRDFSFRFRVKTEMSTFSSCVYVRLPMILYSSSLKHMYEPNLSVSLYAANVFAWAVCFSWIFQTRQKTSRCFHAQQKIRQLGTKKGASFSSILIETRSFVLGWFLFEKNLFGKY